MQKTKSTDPTKLKNALNTLRFNGASGVVEFDENGDVEGKAFSTFIVENGKFTEI